MRPEEITHLLNLGGLELAAQLLTLIFRKSQQDCLCVCVVFSVLSVREECVFTMLKNA